MLWFCDLACCVLFECFTGVLGGRGFGVWWFVVQVCWLLWWGGLMLVVFRSVCSLILSEFVV